MKKVEDYYPVTITTYPDGHNLLPFILDSDIEDHTKEEDLPSLKRFLLGSASNVHGPYAHDVERWLNSKS